MKIKDAPHDSLVVAAASQLAAADRQRYCAEMRHFLVLLGANPGVGLGVAVEFGLEAQARRDRGDPTWAVWAAWEESLALAAWVHTMCR